MHEPVANQPRAPEPDLPDPPDLPDLPDPPDLPDLPITGARLGAVGAALGATVAIGVILGLHALSALRPTGLVELLFGTGPDSLSEGRNALLYQAIGPLAAATAGWFAAGGAARGAPMAGSWMGAATYALGLVIGSYVLRIGYVALDELSGETLLDLVFGSLAITPFAGIVLVPLLVCCVGAGIVWAALLRTVVGWPAGRPVPAHRHEARLAFGTLLILAVVLWALVALSLASFEGGFVD